MRNYANEALKEVVKYAKNKGYRVYTFESEDDIRQIFIENEKKQIGSCSVFFGRSVIICCLH